MLCHPKAPLFWVSDQKLQMYHLRSHILEFLMENDICFKNAFFFLFFYKFQYKFMKKKYNLLGILSRKDPFFGVQFPLLTQRSLFFGGRSFLPHENAPLRGYCTPGPKFRRLCAFSQKIKQLRTKYPMDLARNVPRNSKITVLLQ